MIHLNEHIRRQSLVYDSEFDKVSPPPKFDSGSHVDDSALLMKKRGNHYDARFSTTLVDIRYLHPDSKSLIGSILQHRLIFSLRAFCMDF